MKKKLSLNLLIVYSILFLVLACKNGEKLETKAPSFKTVKLDTTKALVYTEYSSVIQSQTVVEIRPKVSGYLANIAVPEGSLVKKGASIFQIDKSDYQQSVNAAASNVEASRAKKVNANLEVKKLEPLVEKNIISPYELESAKSNYKAAEAVFYQAQAEYKNALINLGHTTIKAPVDGVLGRIYVREGSLVGPSSSEALTTISSDGDVFAYFSFDEKKLALIRKAQIEKKGNKPTFDNNIELILADGSIYEHKGRLESATGIIDRATGSIQLKVIFPNPNLNILSGSSGVLRFPVEYKGVYLIPQKATFELQDKILVYVLNTTDNTVNSKTITVEGISGNNYVVASGIETGTIIVTEGTNKLKEGMKITPKE